MQGCSHITNYNASLNVRTFRNDVTGRARHIYGMARRGIPQGPINWFLPEWMAARGIEGRGAQAKMMELTGWSRATMSQLYNGKQDYSPAVLNAAARALNAEPFELLMQPSRAMAMRRAMASAEEIVSLTHESNEDDRKVS